MKRLCKLNLDLLDCLILGASIALSYTIASLFF